MASTIFFLVLVTLAHFVVGDIVTLPNGQIDGLVKTTYNNVTFYVYLDVPYAKPPVGDLRFKRPQPADNWDGVLETKENKKLCYQLYSNNDMEDEDCLNLNVYTPVAPNTNAALPVMFYLFGGGFIMGSARYDELGPHFFMEEGVVVVTINYRLGPFGFLSTGDEVMPGNNGLWDQNFALQWVQQNIHLFGGDKNKVTLFGQSAGGAGVTYHILSKASAGLFRAAIAQSGTAFDPFGYERHYKSIAYQLAASIDPTFNENKTSSDLLKLFKGLSAQELDDYASNLHPVGVRADQQLNGRMFTPTVVKDDFLTDRMHSLLQNGDFNRIPLMTGICSEEAIYRAGNLDSFREFVRGYESDVTQLVPEDMYVSEENMTQAALEIRKIYTNGRFEDDLSSAVRYFTDTSFTRPAIQWADLQSKFTDVWFYQFSYHGEIGNNNIFVPGADRVSHSEDVGYLWASGDNNDMSGYPEQDQLIKKKYIRLFTNFAKNLNPTPNPADTDILEGLDWPKFSADNRKYLNINDTLDILTEPKPRTYGKWVQAYNLWGNPPFDSY